MPNEPLLRACRNAGGQRALAEAIGTTQQVVWGWINNTSRGTAPEFVLRVEAVSLVSRHELRPDIYPIGSGGYETAQTSCTEDGTWIARDPRTNVIASARTLPEAIAELRRLLTGKRNSTGSPSFSMAETRGDA
jgi:DNA-binding transcriptional regulator YdaS (Cro superfamily)